MNSGCENAITVTSIHPLYHNWLLLITAPSSFYYNKEEVAKVWCSLPSSKITWSRGDTNSPGIRSTSSVPY